MSEYVWLNMIAMLNHRKRGKTSKNIFPQRTITNTLKCIHAM